ncbi:MAG: Rieske (2Fe-2S) protein [Nitrososphaeraceae archaeon]
MRTSGRAKHIEYYGLIANLGSKVYALNDRCNHRMAPLSMGHIQGNIVTCPIHEARFDLISGKKILDPKIP